MNLVEWHVATVGDVAVIDERPDLRGLNMRFRFDEDGILVDLEGELDVMSATDLSRALEGARSAGLHAVRIDMSRVRYVDVVGLIALAHQAGCFTDVGGWARVVNPSPVVAQQIGEMDAHWLLADV